MEPPFVMSKYGNVEALFKDKANYYQDRFIELCELVGAWINAKEISEWVCCGDDWATRCLPPKAQAASDSGRYLKVCTNARTEADRALEVAEECLEVGISLAIQQGIYRPEAGWLRDEVKRLMPPRNEGIV